jgi:NADH:ubiquinone oxidoreductase subunit H
MSDKVVAFAFPIALVFLAGWLAMLAVHHNNDATAWFFFMVALAIAVVFQSVWLYQIRRS